MKLLSVVISILCMLAAMNASAWDNTIWRSGNATITYNIYSSCPVEDYGALADSGTTDNTTAIRAAIAACSTVTFRDKSVGYYKITDTITTTASMVGPEGGMAKIVQATQNKGGFATTSNDITFKRLELQGPQYILSNANEVGISAIGTSAASRMTGLRIEDCDVHDWGWTGIFHQYTDKAKIAGNKVYNSQWAGVRGFSVNKSDIGGNWINNMIAYQMTVRSTVYSWTVSGAGSGEYYLKLAAGGNPGLLKPPYVWEDDVLMTEGTLGSLTAGQFAWGDNDSIGYSTLYVRLSDSADPDGKAANYLMASIGTSTGIFLANAIMPVAGEESTGNKIHNNEISNIGYEGIILEPAHHTTITGNRLTDCYMGIVDGGWWSIATSTYLQGKHNTGTGNVITSTKDNATEGNSVRAGIIVGGYEITGTAYPNIGCVYTGNTISGHGGIAGGNNYGALHIKYNDSSVFANNSIYNSYRAGIVSFNAVNSQVRGNIIRGIQATNGLAGLYTMGGNDYTRFGQNTIDTGPITTTAGGTIPAIRALYADRKAYIESNNGIQNSVSLYPIHNPEYYQMESWQHTTQIAASTGILTPEITITAGSFPVNSHIKLKVVGYKSGTAGHKTVTLTWADTHTITPTAVTETLFTTSSTADVAYWEVEVDIINALYYPPSPPEGYVQRISWRAINNGVVTNGMISGAADTTTDIKLSIDAVCADPADSVISRMMILNRRY